MTDDLIAFLRARYAEEKAIAEQASGGEWDTLVPEQPFVVFDVQAYRSRKTLTSVGALASVQRAEDRAHIARHDPARTLREVDAKRRIVDRYAWLREHGDTGGAAWVLPLLAIPYNTHPDYREEWRP